MKSVPELKKLARDANIPNRSKMNKDELVRALSAILPKETETEDLVRALSPKPKPKYRFKSVGKAVQAGLRMQNMTRALLTSFLQKIKKEYNLFDMFFNDWDYPQYILRKRDIDAIKSGEVKRLMVIPPQSYDEVIYLDKDDEHIVRNKFYYTGKEGPLEEARTGARGDKWIRVRPTG